MTVSSVERTRPVVMHVVFRFDVGGLENGVVNLINHMPADSYRHVVVALTEATDFRRRVSRPDVEFIELHKPPGHGIWLYPALFRMFRKYRPAIVHTRNLAALEAVVPAWAAGAPIRIHSEHGREAGDLAGDSRRYQYMRRLYRPFVSLYVALSRDLADYLVTRIKVPPSEVVQIYNGVDTSRFRPSEAGSTEVTSDCPFVGQDVWLIGTVGRMQAVKDQTTLAKAFLLVLRQRPDMALRLRLVMIGDGPLREKVLAMLEEGGAAGLCWLPGARSDVPDVMRALSCFVLPSIGEGISNTILEAMACGLPVVATDVGGNSDLVTAGLTGEIVPAADAEAMASALIRMAENPERAARMGAAGRAEVERRFGLQVMVDAYKSLYDKLLGQAFPVRRQA